MTTEPIDRRQFLGTAAMAAGAMLAGPAGLTAQEAASRPATTQPKYRISLAGWSLHKMFFAKKIDMLGMVRMCREEFAIGGFEMVNTLWPSPTYGYCRQLKQLAADLDVKLLLIMCDNEGEMTHPDKAERMQAARNHRKWVDAAAVLGCHSIRCNTGGSAAGDPEAVKRAAESFSELLAYAKPAGIQVILENHAGLSSDPDSLVALMKAVNDPFFGTLPDFGNFPDTVDRYDAIKRMMPYAKAVSAKCYDFDDTTGLETKLDFPRLIKIVTEAGYNGFIGIEYEGPRLDEATGIQRAKALLEKLAT